MWTIASRGKCNFVMQVDARLHYQDLVQVMDACMQVGGLVEGLIEHMTFVELREQLVARPEVFAQTVTERLLMYAVNRKLEYFDMPQVRAIVRAAGKENYKLSSIILGIVNSDAFRKQGVEAAK